MRCGELPTYVRLWYERLVFPLEQRSGRGVFSSSAPVSQGEGNSGESGEVVNGEGHVVVRGAFLHLFPFREEKEEGSCDELGAHVAYGKQVKKQMESKQNVPPVQRRRRVRCESTGEVCFLSRQRKSLQSVSLSHSHTP